MIEHSNITKDDSIAIEAYLHTRSLHELARNGQLEGNIELISNSWKSRNRS